MENPAAKQERKSDEKRMGKRSMTGTKARTPRIAQVLAQTTVVCGMNGKMNGPRKVGGNPKQMPLSKENKA